MYFLFGIFFLLCIFFFFVNHWRKKRIIRKICCMNVCQKLHLLNDLMKPFGFFYCCNQDAVTSTLHPWQREFGYGALYDRSAPHFNMVFDCEPIYFHYQGRTWLIEFWKGQYGINIGAEIGVYCADKLLFPWEYDKTLFHSVEDDQLLPLSMSLFYRGTRLFSLEQTHWWLTGFRMGRYAEPEDLVLRLSITCRDEEMKDALLSSLTASGYSRCDLLVHGLIVSVTFSAPRSCQPRLLYYAAARWSQWKNRLFCRIYRWITRPFSCTADQLLYLYFFLPFAFRRMLFFKRCKKQRRYRRDCKKGNTCG